MCEDKPVPGLKGAVAGLSFLNYNNDKKND
jgi:hypothetical protein